MFHASLIWLVWLTSCVVASSLHQDALAVVTIPIHREETQPSHPRRRSFDEYRPDVRYTAMVAIGTPPQIITAQLDPTSGYFMVTALNSSYCKELHCSRRSSFDIGASSTYEDLGRDFNITSPNNMAFNGTFATDLLIVDGEVISTAADIAVNTGSNMANILGMGYVRDDSGSYTGFLQSLVTKGKLKLAAYSVYMRKELGMRGNIILGGVDTAKYTGNLHTMTIPNVNGTRSLPSVPLIGVTGGNTTHTTGLPLYAVLNPGQSATYLPDSIVEEIYRDLGAWFDPKAQIGAINCTMRDKDYNVTFGFPEFNISIPISGFFVPYSGVGLCGLGLVPKGEETAVLGDTFMHKAYVVYDFSNNEISMAPTVSDPAAYSSPDSIKELQAGGVSEIIPEAISVSVTASAPVPTIMRNPDVTDFPLTSNPDATSTSPSSSSTSTQAATSTSKGAAVGPTSSPNNIMAGLIGAGLVLVL